jgi:hypothetical protein
MRVAATIYKQKEMSNENNNKNACQVAFFLAID